MQHTAITRDELQRHQILDATRHCVELKGIDKTRIGDIAKELGIARQTIYNYFTNKNEIIEAMFMRETIFLSDEIVRKIALLDGLENKFTKLCFLAIKGFPESPVVAQLLFTGGKYLQEFGISREAIQLFWEHTLKDIFEENPMLAKQSDEIGELLARTIVSFLIIPGEHSRSDDELESYIRRRIIPGLHLPAI